MDDRYERKPVTLAGIDGEEGDRVVASPSDIAPDLAHYLVEFPFGNVRSRSGLDPRTRNIASVASAGMGAILQQLNAHVHAALDVDCVRYEIAGTVVRTAIYEAFPATPIGLAIAKEVFTRRPGD